MLLPVEAFMNGIGGEDLPEEFGDFEVMREMGWTWPELLATPPYVRRMCSDFINLERQAQAEAVADDKRG